MKNYERRTRIRILIIINISYRLTFISIFRKYVYRPRKHFGGKTIQGNISERRHFARMIFQNEFKYLLFGNNPSIFRRVPEASSGYSVFDTQNRVLRCCMKTESLARNISICISGNDISRVRRSFSVAFNPAYQRCYYCLQFKHTLTAGSRLFSPW